MQHATLTLTEDATDDPRAVTVESTAAAIAELTTRIDTWPQAATVCDDVLRAVDPAAPALAGVITESLAYSTLQSGERVRRLAAATGTRHGARAAGSGGGRP